MVKQRAFFTGFIPLLFLLTACGNSSGTDGPVVKSDADLDAAELEIDTFINYFYYEIILPVQGARGSAISWASDNPHYPVTDNRITIRDDLEFTGAITLTATFTKDLDSAVRNFTVTVRDKELYGYLMAYFTGNSVDQEQVRYALSKDGFSFTALNSNRPVIFSEEIAETGGVRDPFVMRGADGDFYMTLTDMRSSLGWDSNRGIILLKSNNLITWTHSRINISTKWPASFGNIITAWAPEVVYDRKIDKYMVLFSNARTGWTPHIIHYSYANDTFTDLADEPRQLYYHPEGLSAIDGNIVNLNGKFHLFYKNEGHGNCIARAESITLNGGYELISNDVDEESVAVEGCQTYRLFGTNTFVLIYDRYNNSPSQFGYRTSADLTNWTPPATMTLTGFFPRHGSVIPITREEYERLENYQEWPGIERGGRE